MKRLYNCTAWYDGNGLQSYSTRIITIERKDTDRKITLYNYRSNTTLSHIRKYIHLLETQGDFDLSYRIQKLYEVAKQYKNNNFIISDYDGRIKVL